MQLDLELEGGGEKSPPLFYNVDTLIIGRKYLVEVEGMDKVYFITILYP